MAGTILLVEDDFALAMGTEYALEAEGYQVLHAVNLAEARRLAGIGEEESAGEGNLPDLILLDVMLPDGSGFELCREIRSTNQLIPIIFLTAVGEDYGLRVQFILGYLIPSAHHLSLGTEVILNPVHHIAL